MSVMGVGKLHQPRATSLSSVCWGPVIIHFFLVMTTYETLLLDRDEKMGEPPMEDPRLK